MRKTLAWLSFLLCTAGLLTAIADAEQTGRLIFLSTQLRPIEEAQKMRNLILKDFPREVDYITEQPQQFPVRIKAEEQGRTRTIESLACAPPNPLSQQPLSYPTLRLSACGSSRSAALKRTIALSASLLSSESARAGFDDSTRTSVLNLDTSASRRLRVFALAASMAADAAAFAAA